jgi:hypothetical protein
VPAASQSREGIPATARARSASVAARERLHGGGRVNSIFPAMSRSCIYPHRSSVSTCCRIAARKWRRRWWPLARGERSGEG